MRIQRRGMILKILQRLYFNAWLFTRWLLKMPAQTKEDIALFKKILLKRDKLRVFEWGTGYSTVYYPKLLKSLHKDFLWISVDHNKEWHEKIKKHTTWMVWLRLEEFDASQSPIFTDLVSINKYIDMPRNTKKFDVIIIDGRFRMRCLRVAEQCLAEGGVIILHDAHRRYYHYPLTKGKYVKTGQWWPLQPQPNQTWVSA